MKINKQEEFDKKLIALQAEHSALWKKRYTQGEYVKLKQPYQNGWEKTYILRDDILRRKDAKTIQSVLNLVNSTVRHKDKSFKDSKKRNIPIVLRQVTEAKYNTLLPSQKKWLFKTYDRFRFFGSMQDKTVYKFNTAHMYMLKEHIYPYMITHTLLPQPEIESRLQEISDFMSDNNGWNRLNKIHGYKSSQDYHYERGRKKRILERLLDEELC